jgi:hypothetical protein
VCGVDLAPQSFLAGPQAAGDCQAVVCDGQGAAVSVDDDSDVPSDGNACTLDLCSGGVPSHAPAPAGSACGPGGQLACDGAGTCVGCKQDSDCGAGTACATYTCDTTTGLCSVTYVPDGQGNPGGQTAGDCKRMVCNGSGGVVSIADDTDVPDDGNPCTIDGCALGQPTEAPVNAGTPCGSSFQCDGKGACQACLVDADCGTSTACATPACVGGACVTTYVPSGQGNPGGQTAGDCQKIVCDGSGGAASIADDTDVPDDGNPCTQDACSQGVPSHALLPPGTACGTGLVCDGVGACVGCLADADCGASTACATHHCLSGACVTDDTPYGTGDPGGQVAGDCQKLVCNGTGGITTVPDDTDTQDDGNPCTLDTCSGGAPQHLPVGSGTVCGQGLVCNGTTCASGCVIGGTFYAAGAVNPANPCQVCAPGTSTSAWSSGASGATCNDGNACTSSDHCVNGACVGTAHPCAPTECQVSSLCDGNGGCIVSNKPDGTACGGTFPALPGVCVGGTCAYGCWVSGKFFPYHFTYGSTPEVCLNCDPSISRTSLLGNSCHWGSGSTVVYGLCSGDGVCSLYHDASCQCADCSLKPCGNGGYCTGLPKPQGTACAADSDPCTIDACNGAGDCAHAPTATPGTSCGSGLVCHGYPSHCDAGCVIGGTFYAPGAASPGDPCQICDPTTSTSAWTSQSPCP